MTQATQDGGLPSIVITGASGFLGRHLIAALQDRYPIFAVARRSQGAVGVPAHHHLSWMQVDIADRESVAAAFHTLRRVPGPKLVVHLAAHYDFTGERHPEYRRTNIDGLRHVLDQCRALRPERFVFASSVAACDFPPEGKALDERSAADGDHVYAITKRWGEEILPRYAADFPSVVVRLGAIFSDWCEYPPLYFFLGTWLSRSWNRRVLGGRGQSAVPYLHVRCAVRFFANVVDMHRTFAPGEVLIASTDGCVSHLEAFQAAHLAFHGHRVRPIFMPRPLSRLGLHAMDLAGRLQGRRPFERPWMGRYIDLKLNVNAGRTRSRLRWAPNPRLEIVRRLPFLVENMKNDPIEWHRRNLAALKEVQLTPHLQLFHVFERHERAMLEASIGRLHAPDGSAAFPSYRRLSEDELRWAKRQLFLQLKTSIRTRDVGVFRHYCRQLAERRHQQGFPVDEVVGIISSERDLCLHMLRADPEGAALESALHDHVAMTSLVGIDEIQDYYEAADGLAPPLAD